MYIKELIKGGYKLEFNCPECGNELEFYCSFDVIRREQVTCSNCENTIIERDEHDFCKPIF